MDSNMKNDPILGREVARYLKSLGLDTPSFENGLSKEQKISRIADSFKDIMLTLGLDLNDDSLIDSPQRVAKMFVNETFWGLEADSFPKCSVIDNKMGYDEMLTVKDIKVMSNCEHHFVIIDGFADVAYIPKDKVLGLSKINRVVNYYCRRPQVQERLTKQIFHSLSYILGTEDVAVVIDATHYCVKARGVQDTNSHTVSSKLGGVFKTDPATRAEFLSFCKKDRN